MINRLLTLFLFVSWCSFSLFSQPIRNNNQIFNNPTPGEITIMAVNPIPDDVTPTREAFKEVVDCGFNLATSRGTVSYFKNIFSILGDLKLKYLISSPNFIDQATRKSYISAFQNNAHLGGWLLKDEPAFSTFNSLSLQYKAFYKEDPNHLIYINLVGAINNNFTGDCKTVKDYLNLFQNKFSPSLWSYDYYPFIIRKGKLEVLYDQFYNDLEDFSYMAKKTSRPFWAFCEGLAYETKSYSRPAATEPYLKFAAYNALAYGAQGIVYWTYSLRKSSETSKYTSALVDLNGKKTKAWFDAQKVNQQIIKFNDVFYQCDVKEVKHTGNTKYKGTTKLKGSIGPLKSVISGPAGVLVSRIENNGGKYIVIVNHDPFNNQKITLKLNPGKSVVNLTSDRQPRYSGSGNINITLDKADWLIMKEI